MSTLPLSSRSLSTPFETVVAPVRVLFAVGASTQVPTPIFWSEVRKAPLLAMTEAMVLSAVLVPPIRKVLEMVSAAVILPVNTSAPVPLAMSIGIELARFPARRMGLASVSPGPA